MTEFLSIAEAAERIRTKSLSPLELTQSCLDRIKRQDKKVNAFITLTEEAALDAARAAEREIMAAGPKSPLHGIPIGLKDVFKTRGVPTTAHSRQLADSIPTTDSAAGERLSAAGAVCLGKLATHEFALAGPSFDLPWPPVRNPWDLTRFSGGSSSGPAAAVAAGMILGGPGSDTGGSIRGPAALCGVVGLKPTYGLISRYGVIPTAFSLDHIGPMAWSVADCAIMLQALAGYDPRDPAAVNMPVPNYKAEFSAELNNVKIGVVQDFLDAGSGVGESTRRGIEAVLVVLQELGAELRPVKLAPLEEWKAAGFLILLTEAHTIHETLLREAPEKYGALVGDLLPLGALISGADYIQALRRRRELCTEMDNAVADVDVLICPTQGGVAPLIDAVPKWRSITANSFTMPFNLSGYPAMSVCCGYDDGGLPLAVQFAAKPFREPTLLRVGNAYECATVWRSRRPTL